MQRVIPLPAGVNAYLESLSHPPRGADRLCPFCQVSHLRCHGFYCRWAILHGQAPVRIRVRRLLCPVTRCTVSLLPDFCLRKRQESQPPKLERFEAQIADLAKKELSGCNEITA